MEKGNIERLWQDVTASFSETLCYQKSPLLLKAVGRDFSVSVGV
jgi:hypothetical protein